MTISEPRGRLRPIQRAILSRQPRNACASASRSPASLKFSACRLSWRTSRATRTAKLPGSPTSRWAPQRAESAMASSDYVTCWAHPTTERPRSRLLRICRAVIAANGLGQLHARKISIALPRTKPCEHEPTWPRSAPGRSLSRAARQGAAGPMTIVSSWVSNRSCADGSDARSVNVKVPAVVAVPSMLGTPELSRSPGGSAPATTVHA